MPMPIGVLPEGYILPNFGHAQNTSGATVAPNATVVGTGLTPPRAGTWRNVTGAPVSTNAYGLWLKV